MSIKNKYHVQSIKKEECKEWFLHKHYAHTMPNIIHAFGLYRGNVLCGVCSFGNGARLLHKSIVCLEGITHFELNRLVVDEHKKNITSFFVSRCLQKLPLPCIVVSYADGNQGHHGYIYQATNWQYIGKTSPEYRYVDDRNGKSLHGHTVKDVYGTRSIKSLPEFLSAEKEQEGKYKYVVFLGDRRFIKKCKQNMKIKILPYPKGDNKRYDASYEVKTQMVLF